jgi:hypothetical protein
MKLFLWWAGRGLQILALIQVGVALLVGLETQDPTLELKLLMGGALEFIVGYFMISTTGQKA